MPPQVRALLGLLVASTLSAQTPAPTTPPPPPPVRFTGYVQVRETYRDEVGFNASINRARLSAYGTVAQDVTWRIQGEFRTGSVGTGKASVALQDGYIRYKPGQLGIQAGQFKPPSPASSSPPSPTSRPPTGLRWWIRSRPSGTSASWWITPSAASRP